MFQALYFALAFRFANWMERHGWVHVTRVSEYVAEAQAIAASNGYDVGYRDGSETEHALACLSELSREDVARFDDALNY